MDDERTHHGMSSASNPLTTARNATSELPSSARAHHRGGWTIEDFLAFLRLRARTVIWVAAVFFIIVALITFLQPPRFRSTARLIVYEEPMEESAVIRGNVPALQRYFGLSNVANQVEFLKSRILAEKLVEAKYLQVKVEDPLLPSSIVSAIKSIPTRAGRYLSSLFRAEAEKLELPRRDRYLRIRVVRAFVEPLEYGQRRKLFLQVLDGGSFKIREKGGAETFSGRFNSWVNVGKSRLLLQASPAVKPGERFSIRLYNRERAVDDLMQRITVSRSSLDTSHIIVSLEHPNPILAQELLSSYLSVYQEVNKELKARETRTSLDFIRNELRSAEARLKEAQTRLSDYQEKEGVFDLSVEAKAIVDQLTEFRKSFDLGQIYSHQLRSALQSVEKGKGESIASLLEFPATPEIQYSDILRRFSELIQERNAQLLTKKPEHPDIKLINEEIDALRGQVISVLSADLSRTTRRLSEFKAKIDALEKRLLSFPKIESRLAQLTLDVNANEQTVSLLKEREAAAEIVLGSIVSDAEVLDPPSEAWRAVSPDIFLNLFGGAVFGVFLGILWAIALAATKRRILLPSSVEALGIRFLGNVGLLREKGIAGYRVLKKYQSALEALRSVAESSQAGRRIIGVTSDTESAEHSAFSGALSNYLASLNLRTLLIDADLSETARGEGFGLSNILSVDAEEGKTLGEQIKKNLWVLKKGPRIADAGALFTGERFSKLLESALRSYDWVVVNLAPLKLRTDSILSAKAVGSVVIALRRDVSSISDLEVVVNLCDEHKIAILGAVLTFEQG